MTIIDMLIVAAVVALAGVTAWIVVAARRANGRAGSPAPVSAPASSGLIRVEMIDANMKHEFTPTHLKPEQLPESFEAATTFHLGVGDFEVVEATPMTAAEFRASGKLRLVVRKVKIEQVDVSKLLYSLPTVAMTLPPIAEGSTKLGKQTVEIHEDDWRQIEFVSRSLQDQIDEQLAGIRRIYDEERASEFGFRKLHTREAFESPIAPVRATVADLIAAFETAPARLDGVSYHQIAGLVDHGFAIRLLSGLELIGLRDDADRISALCLGYGRPNNAVERDLPDLATFMSANGLVLIDWVQCEQVEPEISALRGYFTADGGGRHRNLIGFPTG
jgi:hypothetical protein